MAVFHAVWILALVLAVRFVFQPPEPKVMPAAVAGQPPSAPQSAGAGEAVAAAGGEERALSGPPMSPRMSFEQHCEKKLPPTKIDVELAAEDVVYDFSHGIHTLTAHASRGEDGAILGLTKNGLGTQFQWHMNLIEDPLSDRACMRPQIRMLVAYGGQQVYVAREFQPGSCAFNEVLEHENTHVSANRDQLALSALELRGVLKRTMGNRVFYGTRKELERQLTEAVNQYWVPMAKLKFSASSPVHAEIDSEAGYRDVLGRCEGEFGRVLQSLRRPG
ncbi:MAG: hypothetical protein RIR70_1681 [Pseudomonadota bacterium]|jgi:hypothetical protein